MRIIVLPDTLSVRLKSPLDSHLIRLIRKIRWLLDFVLGIGKSWQWDYTKGTPGHGNRVWFDDVVVATEYIGPLHQ